MQVRRQPPSSVSGLCRVSRILSVALLTAWAPAIIAAQTGSPDSAGQARRDDARVVGTAGRLSVVIADFDNKTRDPALDHSLTQALFLEMSQSPYLDLLSDRRVTDALRAQGRSRSEPMTGGLGREVCLRAGSQDVLQGSVALVGSHYALDLKAVDCNTDATRAEQQAAASSRNEVLKALDQVSSRLRAQLGEPAASVKRFGVPAQATTGSLEALEEYSLGLAARRDNGDVPSIAFFKRALERDKSFPMAQAVLAGIYGNLRQPSVAIEYAAAAYKARGRVGERQRFHIAGAYFLATGQMTEEIRNYESWQVVYPNDFVPYNNLGNDYAALGELDQSLHEYNEALRLAPSVVIYTNVAGMEMALERVSAARTTLEDAFARQLDGRYLHQSRYWVAFLQGDMPQMDREVAWAAGKAGDEDALLSMESDTEAYYGRVDRSRQLTDQAVHSAVRAGSNEAAALWRINDALREAEIGRTAEARQGVAAALALSRGRDVELMAAFALARSGEGRAAAELAQTVQKEYPTDSLLKIYWLPNIRAAIDLDAGNSAAALSELKAVLPYELGGAGTFINYVYPAYLRGEAYLLARDGHAAAVEFQKLPDHRGLVLNFVTGSLAYLRLGRAFALDGNTAKARAAYQEFLALWRGADVDVPVALQAKAEYARLQP